MQVNDAVACVVNNSSPEGHLPMDMTVQVSDHGNTGCPTTATLGETAQLTSDIIDTCMQVNDAVACVVNNSSPEGHLPMDMTVQVSDHGNTG
ncbi:hypothetical protein PYW07_012473 [Mythimna separata]|nr:hypothetical protein PYW07_012473 [Mythimna separata]